MEKIEFKTKDILFAYYLLKEGNLTLFGVLRGLILKKYEYKNNKGEVLFYISNPRSDYESLLKNILKQCDKKVVAIQEIVRKPRFNLKNIINAIINISQFHRLKNIKLPQLNAMDSTEYANISYFDRIIIYLYLIKLIGQKTAMRDTIDFTETKAVFVLCDVWESESCLIDIANEKGVLTICGQHALFMPGVEKYVDVLNFWDVPSKIVLQWGTYNKELFEKYNTKLVCKVCGNPLLNPIISKCDSQILGVALDGARYKEYNRQIIAIAERYAKTNKMKVSIRLHPSQCEDDYAIDSKISNYEKDLDNAVFILAHVSTMAISYLACGKRVYVYKTDIPFFELDESICFRNYDELEACVMNNSDGDLSSVVKSLVTYVGEESESMYKQAFSELLGHD